MVSALSRAWWAVQTAAKPPPPGRALQKGVASLPGGLLGGKPLRRRQGGHVPLPQKEGDAPLPAPVPDEGGVAAGGRPQVVVKMGGGDGEVPPLREIE